MTLLGGKAIGALAQAATFIVLARAMSLSDFGQLMVVVSIATFLAALLEFGFNNSALRVSALDDQDTAISSMVATRAIAALAVTAATVGISTLALDASVPVAAGGALLATTEALAILPFSIMTGQRREKAAVWLLLLRRALVLVTVAALALGTEPSAQITATALGVASLLGLVASFVPLRRQIAHRPRVRQTLSEARAYWVVSLSTSIRRIEPALAGALGSLALAAYVGIASRIATPLQFFSSTMNQAVVPDLATGTREARDHQFRVSRRYMALVGIALVISAPFAAWLSPLVLGSEYASAAPLIGGVVAAGGFANVSQAYLAWEYAHGIRRSVSMLSTWLAAARIAGVAFFLLTGSVWGLAATLVAVEATRLAALQLLHTKHTAAA